MFVISAILPKTEPVLKETLGKLTTEEFYNPYKRVEMELAKVRLNEELNIKGIIVEKFVRYFRYSSEIQRNIEEKLKDQLVFKIKLRRGSDTASSII